MLVVCNVIALCGDAWQRSWSDHHCRQDVKANDRTVFFQYIADVPDEQHIYVPTHFMYSADRRRGLPALSSARPRKALEHADKL